MAKRKQIDEIMKDIDRFPYPKDIFTSYHLQSLKYKYLKNWEPVVREILAALGFREDHIDKICKERLSEYQPGMFHIDFGEDNTPDYFYKAIESPKDISTLKKWLENEGGFKKWDDIISEVLAPYSDERVIMNEVFELDFCLLLDMVYSLLNYSKSDHLLGFVAGKDVIDLVRSDFSGQTTNDSFVKMIEGLLNKKYLNGIKFCDHKHYLRDVRNMNYDPENPNPLCGNDLERFRFLQDKDTAWNRKRKEINVSFDAGKAARLLLRILPEYYYEIARSSVYRITKRHKVNIGREYVGLYCQMPYFYISEWLIGTVKASLKAQKRKESVLKLCPLAGREASDNGLLSTYVKNGIIENFNRINSCNIAVDFGNEASTQTFLAHDKAYEGTGSNVSKSDRRITQFCLFQYLVWCIERFEDIFMNGSDAAGVETNGKGRNDNLTDNRELADGYLLEIFRAEYLVNKLKFFRGYQLHLKRKIVDLYNNDMAVEDALKGIESTLFWNTFLYFLLKRAKYKTISVEEIAKVKNAYNNCMLSVSKGGVELLYNLAKMIHELNEKYKFPNTGSQFLNVIKNLLNETLNESSLEGTSWDRIDKILEEVYKKRNR